MTIRDILNILFRRKVVIVSFLLAAIAGGYAGLKLFSPTYAATSKLLVRVGAEDLYMPVLPSSQMREPILSVVREEQLRSESAILTSPDLARQVVDELTPQALFPGIDTRHPWYTPKGVMQGLSDLYRAVEGYFIPLSAGRSLVDRAVDRFEKDLRVEAVNNSSIVEVTLRSKLPDAAALGVNTLVARYLELRAHIYQREQAGFVTGQLETLDAELKEAEGAVDRFRIASGAVDVDVQRAAQLQRLEEVRKRSDENRVALAEAERRAAVLREQMTKVPPTTRLSDAQGPNNLAVSEMGKQLADLRRQEADILARFSSRDQRLLPLRDGITAVEAMLARLRGSTVSTEEGINPLHARIRDDLLQAETLAATLHESLTRWTEQEQRLVAGIETLNRQEPEYRRLVQDLDVMRHARQLYLEKAEESRFLSAQVAAHIGNVSIVNPARANYQPVSPKLWLVLVGVLFVGVIGGVGFAFVLEFLDDSLRSDADVKHYLKLPILAKVPDLAASSR